MRGRFIYIALVIFFTKSIFGQDMERDSIPRIAPISYDIEGNRVRFNATMPALHQIAGAPKAFYTYYWEFGDGDYSQKEKPEHQYTQPGNYTAQLWATNNYDNGPPPASRPVSVKVSSTIDEASLDTSSLFEEDEHLMIKTNRDPVPNQELVLITAYKNTQNYVSNGKLYLFYNDTKFKDNNFTLEDTRMYHGEKIVPLENLAIQLEPNHTNSYLASTTETSNTIRNLILQDSTKRTNLPLTLEDSKAQYRNYQVVEFYDMQPGEERNIFRTLKTTPEMLKDTSAIVTLRSIYVPDDNYDNHTVKETEMEIVTSHDPNKMSSNGWLMNYRLVRFKRLKFKIRFQNNGEGPANTIRLETDVPEMFDKSTLNIEGIYPDCPICPKNKEVNYSCLDTVLQKDKIIFKFNRIYLPGSQQKNVAEIDSTKGFVKYSLKFGENFHKKKTKSRTAIYFDKNEPIITNYAVTRFMPGISIGAKAGYSWSPDLDNSREYFVGTTLSPFKSYRAYYQAELMASLANYDQTRRYEERTINADGSENIVRFTESNSYTTTTLYAVPGSIRYNVSNYFAIGSGIQAKIDLTSKNEQQTIGEGFFLDVDGQLNPNPDLNQSSSATIEESFINFQTGVFVGFNVGTIRIGPSFGARYIHYFDSPHSQIQLYGIWKF
ncbi:PKD domain-containing protein [Aquimarina brevivitae]|uniref:PKD domain-containing protein n=1 Tax=Aquimarina brevivitae TaxID=323412 RepID=A0A4Q7PFH8_9FLAO|nr:PKD domain-containing protein [Aquimarina brevivitae]RZS98937.1 PKD domain-containing protein [Aquimarina brevivitae]